MVSSTGFWQEFVRDLRFDRMAHRVVHSALVGVVAGGGAILFFWLLQTVLHYTLGGWAGFYPPEAGGEAPLYAEGAVPFRRWLLFIIPALGGIASGWLVFRFAPEAEGHGTDAAIEAFHHSGGYVRARVPLIKTAASALTMGTGGSGGREGPIAQIGAGFGSFLGTVLKLPERERRILMLSGLGAGVGAIFRAPLAGAIFAVEVLYRSEDIEHEALIPAVVSSIVAYSLYASVFGFNPLFRTPDFTFHQVSELIPYTVLGLACTIVGWLYVRAFYGVRDLFHSIHIPAVWKPAIGGLITGVVGVCLPQTLALGYGQVQFALDGKLPWTLLLLIAVGKIVTTAFSIGSGGSGGVFGPAMVIGGCLGGSVGLLAERFVPHLVVNPQAFVIVGMVGFFSGIASTPISTIIMVSEMTGNYNLLVPSMWVCAITFILLRRCGIYERQLNERSTSPAHRGEMAVDVLQGLRVRDWMRREVVTVPATMTLRQAMELEAKDRHSRYPVVDDKNCVLGVLKAKNVVQYLATHEANSDPVVTEVMTRTMPLLTPDADLYEALHRIDVQQGNILVVVDAPRSRRLVGIMTRNDILHAHRQVAQRELPGVRRTATGNVYLPADPTVAEAMSEEFDSVPPDMPLEELTRWFHATGHHGCPVVDAPDRLVGVVTRSDLERAERMSPRPSTVIEIATRNPVVCYAHETLTDALRKFVDSDVGRIPVVDAREPRRIEGLLRRNDVITVFGRLAKEASAKHELPAVETDVLSEARFIELVVSGESEWAHRTVRELPWSGDSLVVAIRRHDKTLIPHGNTRLEPGDCVIIMTMADDDDTLRDLLT